MEQVTDTVLEAHGVYHIYREADMKTVALRDAEVILPRGSWTAVMGPSGSGKSTLLHILAGLLEPSAGSIVVDGVDVNRLAASARAAWRRRSVGLVMQRDNLHPHLDLEGNIALPLRLQGMIAAEIRNRVGRLLSQMGLRDRRHHRVGQLSGGEAQRAAIAVALAPGPKVLLADEPTGELDEATAIGILDVLEALAKYDGLAILTVTHNKQVGERANRRLRMLDGKLSDAS